MKGCRVLQTGNQEAIELAAEWRRWLRTRKFFAPPMPKGVLAKLQAPSGSNEPDGPCSPRMQAFHAAFLTFEQVNQACFVVVYCKLRGVHVKAVAHELRISRSTFYARAHKTADELVRRMKAIENEP